MSEPLDLDKIDSVSRSGFLTVPPETVRELTSTIRARDVRIGELEKGLKPFAKVGGTLIGNSIQYSIRATKLVGDAASLYAVDASDFFRARALLKDLEKGDE